MSPVRSSPSAGPPSSPNETEPADRLPIPLSDKRIPQHIRQHGQTFAPPASDVIDGGNDEYTLLSSDGEILDFVWHEAPRQPGPVSMAVASRLLRLPASPFYGVACALLLMAPTVALLARAWTTQSLHLLMAGLLAGIATALAVALWYGIKATE